MRAFVIGLSKIESSIRTAIPVVNQLKEYGFDAELFEGTYGDEAKVRFEKEKRKVHPYGIKKEPLSTTDLAPLRELLPKDPNQSYELTGSKRAKISPIEGGKMCRAGVLGCFYSHYRLWEKCLDLNQPIFIFEDDVIFKRPYIPVNFDSILIVALGKDLYKTSYAGIYENPPPVVSVSHFPRTSMPGAVGYGITPGAAKKLLKTYRNTFLPADNAINQYEVKIDIHSHLIGRAALEEDGKISLTTSWKIK